LVAVVGVLAPQHQQQIAMVETEPHLPFPVRLLPMPVGVVQDGVEQEEPAVVGTVL
jgi:hypothetical protein